MRHFYGVDLHKVLPKTNKKEPTGTDISYVGKKRETPVTCQFINYDEKRFSEKESSSVDEIEKLNDKSDVTWVNVSGVHNMAIIQKIGEIFDIHPLVLEDISNTTQRAKVEEHSKYIFAVLKIANANKKKGRVSIEQVSLLIGKNYVISFHETDEDVLDPLRDRLRHAKGRVRKQGSDYLAYSIMDALVDHYFAVLEYLGEQIEDMEVQLVKKPTQETLNTIYTLKRRLIYLRKAVWPMREVISSLQRMEHSFVKKSTIPYLQDLYDHTIQVIETIETFRDMVSGMLDLYLSTMSNRMNEIMKVLTVFAAIFIPLTFVAGVYGMNFHYMPELDWEWGYPAFWVFIVFLTAAMLFFFKKKKWL